MVDGFKVVEVTLFKTPFTRETLDQTGSIRKFRLRLHGIDPRTFRVYTGSIPDRAHLVPAPFARNARAYCLCH